MKINEKDFYWEFCCYELMENCYMQGLNPNWGHCPFCGQEFEYTEEADGGLDEMHPM